MKVGDFVRIDDKPDSDYTAERNEYVNLFHGHILQIDAIDPSIATFLVTDKFHKIILFGVPPNRLTPV